jgi:hypothetical protein
VTTMILLMLFLIVLNADRAFPPSLQPSRVLTSLLSTPDHKQEIMFDIHWFWSFAPRCLRFWSYKIYAEPKHSEYSHCIHEVKIMCCMHSCHICSLSLACILNKLVTITKQEIWVTYKSLSLSLSLSLISWFIQVGICILSVPMCVI